MQPGPISPDEIRTGDLVRWERFGVKAEGRVKNVFDFARVLELGDVEGVRLGVSGALITLLERPLPAIPREEGVVVRRKDDVHAYVFRDGGDGLARAGWYLGGNYTAARLDETPTLENFEILTAKGMGD